MTEKIFMIDVKARHLTEQKKHCLRTQYFDSYNNFISKQKLQQGLKSWSNVSLVLFAKGQEKHKTKIKNANDKSN